MRKEEHTTKQVYTSYHSTISFLLQPHQNICLLLSNALDQMKHFVQWILITHATECPNVILSSLSKMFQITWENSRTGGIWSQNRLNSKEQRCINFPLALSRLQMFFCLKMVCQLKKVCMLLCCRQTNVIPNCNYLYLHWLHVKDNFPTL